MMDQALSLQEAIRQGFVCDFIHPPDLRIGYTLRLSKPINGLPTLDESLHAWRRRRSIPFRDHVVVTLQSQAELEMLLDHVIL